MDTDLPQSILERLKKMQALAESGIDGDRENARRMLQEMLLKYGITLKDIASGEEKWHRFICANELEVKLLSHVVLKICQTNKITNGVDKKKKWARWYKLTAVQHADVTDAFAHYRKEFQTVIKDSLSALIQRHNLFSPEEDEDDGKEPTSEEMERAKRILSLMAGLSSQDWQKTKAQITGSKR